jgi:hypothetical protein
MQPITSGDQISRSCPAVPSPSMNESTMLIAKIRVPAKRTAALSHSIRRGSRAHQRQPRPGSVPSPASRGLLIACRSEA